MYGGGQERGLRPGTLPVQLIVGLGTAAELAFKHHDERMAACKAFKDKLLKDLEVLGPVIHGNQDQVLLHSKLQPHR